MAKKVTAVVKLHRDSEHAQGWIAGVVEHICTGHTIEFADAQALTAALLAHAACPSAQAYRAEAEGAA